MNYLKPIVAGIMALFLFTFVLLINGANNISVLDLIILYFVLIVWLNSLGD